MPPFERLADEAFAYLTSTGRRTGRRTGRPHTIEIWFSLSWARGALPVAIDL